MIGRERERCSAFFLEGLQLLLELGPPAVPAQLADQELHPVALLVLEVAEAMEHADHGLRHLEDLARGQELVQQAGRGGHGRGAAARDQAEPALAVADARAEAEIVDGGEGVVLGGAPFEGDLELARERGAQGMAQQVPRQLFRVGRDVEDLVRGHARVRAARDVADGAAAGLARGEARLGDAPHDLLHVVRLHEVELHVLPRRDVAEAARPGVGGVGEGGELGRVQDPLRDLDPDHLDDVLALAVVSAHQPVAAPLVGSQLATLELVERGRELVDLGFVREREPRAAQGLRIVDGGHDGSCLTKSGGGLAHHPDGRSRPP
jgi:hypothetical protein